MVDGYERAILELVAAHGPVGWYGVATRLGGLGQLDPRNLVHVLDGLTDRGLLAAVDGSSATKRWTLAERGRVVLAGPLSSDELATWSRELAGDLVTAIGRIAGELGAPQRLVAGLLQVLAGAEECARGVVTALGCLEPDARSRLAEALTTDPRPAVRVAFYTGFAALRFDIPGQSPRLFPDAECVALLRRGLADPDREVRAQATGMVFGTELGAHVPELLLANLESDDRDLRWRTLAALGGATDEATRAALVRHLDGPDPGLACIAVQALGARADGRALCQERADGDPRDEVRNAARHALTVARARAEWRH